MSEFYCNYIIIGTYASVKFNSEGPARARARVAQIAHGDTPIETVGTSVPTPESGDQLAQRSLQVTTPDNAGFNL
jgi:hypothetical protein